MLESAKTQRVERGDCSAGVYVHTVCVELVGTDGEAGHVSRTSTFTRDFAEDVSIRALDMVAPPPLIAPGQRPLPIRQEGPFAVQGAPKEVHAEVRRGPCTTVERRMPCSEAQDRARCPKVIDANECAVRGLGTPHIQQIDSDAVLGRNVDAVAQADYVQGGPDGCRPGSDHRSPHGDVTEAAAVLRSPAGAIAQRCEMIER